MFVMSVQSIHTYVPRLWLPLLVAVYEDLRRKRFQGGQLSRGNESLHAAKVKACFHECDVDVKMHG